MRRGIMFGLLTFALAAWADPARAELTISFSSPSIQQGQMGTVDVYATSDNNDTLNTFGFQVQVSGPNDLQFVQPTADTWVNSTNPPYVLQSEAPSYGATSTGDSVGTTSSLNDTYTGTNQTQSLNTVTLTTGTKYLLAVLTVDTTGTNVGDTYTISLVPSSGNGSNNSNTAVTFFDTVDLNFHETGYVGFTSTSGTITITPASVPEPGSLVLGLSAMAMVAGVGAGRRRRGRGRKGLVR